MWGPGTCVRVRANQGCPEGLNFAHIYIVQLLIKYIPCLISLDAEKTGMTLLGRKIPYVFEGKETHDGRARARAFDSPAGFFYGFRRARPSAAVRDLAGKENAARTMKAS